MNIQNWLKNILKKIQESNDDSYKIEIKKLNIFIKVLKDKNVLLTDDIKDNLIEINTLKEDLLSADKHSSVAAYEEWSNTNIIPKATYYDFGSGRKQVHTIFADSLKDEKIIRDFITNDMEFEVDENWTVDQLVYWFNRRLSQKYPTHKYYASDMELYGQVEYWATAKQTILKLRTNKKSFDCDDSTVLRYSCLYYLLKDYFPTQIWRLRGFIVDIWTGGGHALLAWVKEGPNDWIPIETTFYDDREGKIWNGNYRIRDQLLYQIRYSFDNETEYKRI